MGGMSGAPPGMRPVAVRSGTGPGSSGALLLVQGAAPRRPVDSMPLHDVVFLAACLCAELSRHLSAAEQH